jgi:hypothetical protein
MGWIERFLNSAPSIGTAVAPGLRGAGAGNANLFENNDRRGPNPAAANRPQTPTNPPTKPLEVTPNPTQTPQTPTSAIVTTPQKYLFPLDLETKPIPYVLIKIYETQTGSDINPVDETSQSFRTGSEAAGNFVAENATGAAAAAGGAYGAFYGGLFGALQGGRNAIFRFAGAGAAAGAVTGAAATELGPDVATAVIDRIGEITNVQDTTDRAKKLIRGFALKRNTLKVDTFLALLMPETLAISQQNDYGEISFTQASGGLGQLAQAVGSLKGKTGNPDPFIAEAAGRLAETFINEDFAKIGFFATTGMSINPQLELIYNAPQLREFTLDFRLVPRNRNEALAIKNIINSIRYYGAPRITAGTGGRYLIPPAQFELEFYHTFEEANQFLFKTKKCVLEDISIDYTGGGSFATFNDGSPVETRMSVRFKETQIIDREAIQQGF